MMSTNAFGHPSDLLCYVFTPYSIVEAVSFSIGRLLNGQTLISAAALPSS